MEFLDPKKALASLGVFHNAVVADCGAGNGDFAYAAAELAGPSGKIYVFDIKADVVARVKNTAAERGLQNIETLTVDLEKKNGTHIGDSVCDFAIVSNVLFLAHHKDIFLEEVVRILKSGGKILFIDWTAAHGGLGPAPDMVFSADSAHELFNKMGLVTLSEVSAGAYHYGYILQKP
jgi:ubiquinone/menaquinone biosynthesis C-methylase UbiE